jgi:thioredoxin 1
MAKKIPGSNLLYLHIVLTSIFLLFMFCNGKNGSEKTIENSSVKTITSEADFNAVLDNAGNGLLVFDMYAAWCQPCKMLAPILESIANANPDKAAFYKINVDDQQQLAQKYQVSSIPFVMFIKNKTVVESLTGLQTQEVYQQTLDKYTTAP